MKQRRQGGDAVEAAEPSGSGEASVWASVVMFELVTAETASVSESRESSAHWCALTGEGEEERTYE